MPDRVLVTGGAGFVGSHVVDRLVENGNEVLVVDDMSTGSADNVNPAARLEQIDIRDGAMSALARSFRPHRVVHCAAQASVPASMADPTHDADVNIGGGLNLACAAIDARCDTFVYITTGGALYGNPDYLPCDEEHPVRPISAYGLSKWAFELYARMLLAPAMRLHVLRPANVYGPRQDPHGESGVIAIFSNRMLRGDTVTINGDGEHTRDWVYVEDVARACEMACGAGEPVTVNVGAGRATSVKELFGALAKETGYTLPPVHGPERPGDVRHISLDSSRARRLLGWSARVPFDEGLRRTVDWFRRRDS